jgi:hypothetical protein
MEPDDLLCSRNARPQKALVERAQWKINQPPSLESERASLEGAFRWITVVRWRSKGQPWPLLKREVERIGICSLDTRSGSPSSPPSREKIEERWSLRREKTPEPFYFSRSMGNGSDTFLPSYWRRYAIRRSCRSSSCTARGKKARIRSLL